MLNLVQVMPEILKIGWNFVFVVVYNCCLTNEPSIFSFSQHIITYFMQNHQEYLIYINQNLKNFLILLCHLILKADKEMSQCCLGHLHTIMNLYNYFYDVKKPDMNIDIDPQIKAKLKIYKDQDEFFQNSCLPCVKMLYHLSPEMPHQEYFENLKLGVDIIKDYKNHLT